MVQLEVAHPSVGAGCPAVDEASDHPSLQDEIRRTQATSLRQQLAKQRARHGVRRVRDHSELSLGQVQSCGVGGHDSHGLVGEALAQDLPSAGVQLDSDHLRARGHQMVGKGAVSGTDVEDQLAGLDGGGLDDPCRPVVREPVPSPELLLRRSSLPVLARGPSLAAGHGGPSPCSKTCAQPYERCRSRRNRVCTRLAGWPPAICGGSRHLVPETLHKLPALWRLGWWWLCWSGRSA